MPVATKSSLTLDGLLTKALDAYTGGLSVRDAVSRTLEDFEPDGEAREALIRKGLIHFLAETKHVAPFEDASDEGYIRRRFHMVPADSPIRRDVLARLRFEAADGTSKSWLEFTAEDVARFRSLAAAQVAGWRRRVELCDRTSALLAEYSVERVSDLPADCLDELRTMAEQLS